MIMLRIRSSENKDESFNGENRGCEISDSVPSDKIVFRGNDHDKCSGSIGFWTLFIDWYLERYKITQRFVNWKYTRPQVWSG
jgi:hypothetical protein